MSQTTAAPITTSGARVVAIRSSASNSTANRATRFASDSLAPITLAVAILAASAGTAGAQTSAEHPATPSRFEFVISSGGLLPTGDQRNVLKRAEMTIAQASYAVRPYLAVTTSAGWARSRNIGLADAPKLDVFTYDVGAELRADRWLSGKALTFTPFAGAGAGGRSYNYRSLDVDATHNLAAYGSAGGELGYRRIRFRIEARDYVSGFKPLQTNGTSGRRNDVSVMAGFRITAH